MSDARAILEALKKLDAAPTYAPPAPAPAPAPAPGTGSPFPWILVVGIVAGIVLALVAMSMWSKWRATPPARPNDTQPPANELMRELARQMSAMRSDAPPKPFLHHGSHSSMPPTAAHDPYAQHPPTPHASRPVPADAPPAMAAMPPADAGMRAPAQPMPPAQPPTDPNFTALD